MSDVWIPGFDRRPGRAGGTYDETSHPKFGWHTWEGTSWAGAEAAFKPYPPHVAVSPYDRVRRQYIPLNRHAYAFAGNDADDSFIIQVEVAGFAKDTRTWSDEWCDWLGREVVRPIAELTGIPPIVVPVGFHDGTEGITPYIASKASPIRLSQRELDAFAGHLGHQHMPSPDQHWDPGALRIQRILAASGSPASQPPESAPRVPVSLEDPVFLVVEDVGLFAGFDGALAGFPDGASFMTAVSESPGVPVLHLPKDVGLPLVNYAAAKANAVTGK